MVNIFDSRSTAVAPGFQHIYGLRIHTCAHLCVVELFNITLFVLSYLFGTEVTAAATIHTAVITFGAPKLAQQAVNFWGKMHTEEKSISILVRFNFMALR